MRKSVRVFLSRGVLIFCVVLLASAPLVGGLVTYDATGTVDSQYGLYVDNVLTPVPAFLHGLSFTASFTFDTSFFPPSGFTTYYEPSPPFQFTLVAGGLAASTIPTTHQLDNAFLGDNQDNDNFSISANLVQITSSNGWAASGTPQLDFNKTQVFLWFTIGVFGPDASITTPGGSITVPAGNVQGTKNIQIHFSATSMVLVPEPSSVVLAALALAGLMAWRWRRRR